MSEATVFVGAIGGGGHGEQIVKALRCVERGRYRIVGGDASQYCPQFADVDVPVIMPKANDPAYLDALLAICRKFGVQAVFHGCEPELAVLNKNRALFAEQGLLLPINAADVIETCMDKQLSGAFLESAGFVPPISTAFNRRDVVDEIEKFPVIVKPALGGGGSRDTYIAQSKNQLKLLAEFLDVENETFLIQEYVGTFEQEYTVGVLHDLDGEFIGSIAIRRLINSALNMRFAVRNKTGRDELGEWLVVSSGVSQGEVGDFPEVRAQCEAIAGALGSRGPLNIQCRFVDGKIKVFEINPRFSGTTSLRAMMGFNEPDLLLRRHLLGETDRAPPEYQMGMIIRSLRETILPENPPADWRTTLAQTP
ncbi:MAG: ATP-grasp domain-containing protein [Salinarimonadaceae bacterium]|nr:MAG: ATP-grasp domain-containing protein [Salinarimonadaceae bacterium]